MAEERTEPESVARGAAQFATTHWSVVLAAGNSASQGSKEALEKLCQAYWYPLYAFARRKGNRPEDAQDLTQSFFAYLLEKRLVGKARRETGRFRSFLLGCFRNYLARQFTREHAQIRGGGKPPLSWDVEDAERRLTPQTATTETPEQLFERKWALAVLGQAMEALEAEYRDQGKADLFESLHPFLEGTDEAPRYREVAKGLGTSEGAARVAVFRLRQRYREFLRAVVAHTVDDLNEVDVEIQHLMQALTVR